MNSFRKFTITITQNAIFYKKGSKLELKKCYISIFSVHKVRFKCDKYIFKKLKYKKCVISIFYVNLVFF